MIQTPWSLFQKPVGHVFNVPEYQVPVPGRAIKWHVENVPHRLLEQTPGKILFLHG
jgi:hypothetical protein